MKSDFIRKNKTTLSFFLFLCHLLPEHERTTWVSFLPLLKHHTNQESPCIVTFGGTNLNMSASRYWSSDSIWHLFLMLNTFRWHFGIGDEKALSHIPYKLRSGKTSLPNLRLIFIILPPLAFNLDVT